MKIIDVSRWQGDIDWIKAATEVEDVTMRGSIGANGFDTKYARNWPGAKAAGIPKRAMYHYIITEDPAVKQVENIKRVSKGDYGTGIINLDAERREDEHAQGPWPLDKRQRYTQLVWDMIQLLQHESDKIRGYSSVNEWQQITTVPDWSDEFVRWIAQYNLAVSEPDLAPWLPTWDRWQYWNKGIVDGCPEPVDLNRDSGAAPIPVPPPQTTGAAAIIRHADAILKEVQQ